jgi:transcriptional regulator with XRE-family HTH domain
MNAATKSWFRERVGYVPIPRLRRARLAREVGVRELARRAGVSKTTIVRAEDGFDVQSRVAVAFAEALEADILELMAPRTLSDQDVEELRRVFAGGEVRAYGAEEEETDQEVAIPILREESLNRT